MTTKTSKSPSWTSIPVKHVTADAVLAHQVAYRLKTGGEISQDRIVAVALSHIKTSDLPAPIKRPRGAQADV